VQVRTPKKLTRDQRKLVEQLAEALPKEKLGRGRGARATRKSERNLFDRVKDMFG